ncbi:MAG: hypothetical protein J6W24_08780, partial [Prevotella sp.]|nr:hypothetical protein [Prevotella sp.]
MAFISQDLKKQSDEWLRLTTSDRSLIRLPVAYATFQTQGNVSGRGFLDRKIVKYSKNNNITIKQCYNTNLIFGLQHRKVSMTNPQAIEMKKHSHVTVCIP